MGGMGRYISVLDQVTGKNGRIVHLTTNFIMNILPSFARPLSNIFFHLKKNQKLKYIE